jgi:hypothetical protein
MCTIRQPFASRRHTNVLRETALGLCTLNVTTAVSPRRSTRRSSGTMFVFRTIGAMRLMGARL